MIQRFVHINYDDCYATECGYDPFKIIRNICTFKSKKEFERVKSYLAELVEWTVPYDHKLTKIEAMQIALYTLNLFGAKMEGRMGNHWEKKRGKASKFIRYLFGIRDYRFPIDLSSGDNKVNAHLDNCKKEISIKGPEFSESKWLCNDPRFTKKPLLGEEVVLFSKRVLICRLICKLLHINESMLTEPHIDKLVKNVEAAEKSIQN